MTKTVEEYADLATRENSLRSYASTQRHFEETWGGVLPASSDSIARYLAEHAELLSISTLETRLSGLSRWHRDHGFSDPTKISLVKDVLKGIRRAHTAPQAQAQPIAIEHLTEACARLDQEIIDQSVLKDRSTLPVYRDKAILLLGFWRAFRADELSRLRVEHITIDAGKGISIFIPTSKGDRQSNGRTVRCPALSKLCPVVAVKQWLTESKISEGPLFRRIDRWGLVSDSAMRSDSYGRVLRRILGVDPMTLDRTYSSHSLRRGFATWARDNGWDLRELMEYVGWQDIKSALRYMDVSDSDLNERFETGLIGVQTKKPRPAPSPRPAPGSNVIQLKARIR